MEHTFLTKEQIKAKAPSVYAMSPAKDVSDKYVYIPTYKIIDDMEKLGWYPAEVKQSIPRDEKYMGFQKHSIRFRTPDQAKYTKVGDRIPELHYTGSHDRSYRVMMSIAINELVCGNGLITPVEIFGNLSVKHINVDFISIEKAITEIVSGFSQIFSKIEEYQTIKLANNEKKWLAESAHLLRFGEDNKSIEPMRLIEPRREEDKEDNLWKIFNIIQENVIKGGVEYTDSANRERKTRTINNIQQEVKLNKQLWLLMEAIRSSRHR